MHEGVLSKRKGKSVAKHDGPAWGAIGSGRHLGGHEFAKFLPQKRRQQNEGDVVKGKEETFVISPTLGGARGRNSFRNSVPDPEDKRSLN